MRCLPDWAIALIFCTVAATMLLVWAGVIIYCTKVVYQGWKCLLRRFRG